MVIDLKALAERLLAWMKADVLQWEVGVAVALCVVVLVAAWAVGRRLQRRAEARLQALQSGRGAAQLAPVLRTWSRLLWLLIAAALFGVCMVGAKLAGQVYSPFRIGLSLSLLVAVIRMSSSLIQNRIIGRFIEIVTIVAAVLSVFGVLHPVADYLSGLSFSIGESDLSVYSVIKGLVLVVILLELAKFVSKLLERRIAGSSQLTPSLQVLWIKATHILLFLLALVIALQSIGFSLTSVTVFSGAVGVGIGFGLQKIFSNFISGVILLLESSIKPGDTIEVSNIYGQVKSMNARFVSMTSRDGKEYLIPNEKFIISDVVNWTYSSSNVRVRIPVGVSYESDVEECLKLLEECVKSVPRILENPAPRAVVRQFGADSIDLELRVWIKDPESGLGRVRSDALRAIWRTFKEHGVTIPYPQRDLHLVSVSEQVGQGLAEAGLRKGAASEEPTD
ncbi:MAG: mechanosensitive ion channel family protein [Desulfovibrionaceae bacterium]